MSKGAPAKVSGPQLSSVVCGSTDNVAVAKLNLNCPLGIYLSYSLQLLRVEIDKKVKEINDQVNLVQPTIPPDTPEEKLEEVTVAAKEDAVKEKERLQELASKFDEIGAKMAASSSYNVELLDESNSLLQCQENMKSLASDILKPYGKYTLGLLQESENEPPCVLPLMVGASVVALKKGK